MNNIWSKFRIASRYWLEDIMDWFVYMNHLQSVLRIFDAVAAFLDDLLIKYFRNGLMLDKKICNLDNWQKIIEQAVDVKFIVICQAFLLIQKSDACCFQVYRPTESDKFRSKNKDT